MSSGRLVVSNGWSGSLNRVCVVDMSERIIQCYGGYQDSGACQLYYPRHLAVDGYGTVVVADWGNNKIVLLSPSLTLLSNITVSLAI